MLKTKKNFRTNNVKKIYLQIRILIFILQIKSLHYSTSKCLGGSRQHLAASAPRKGHRQRFFGAMLPWTPSAMLSTEMYVVGGWAKAKLMRCQFLILMNENCWWLENPLYTSSQTSLGHFFLFLGNLWVICFFRFFAAVCFSFYAMADCLS